MLPVRYGSRCADLSIQRHAVQDHVAAHWHAASFLSDGSSALATLALATSSRDRCCWTGHRARGQRAGPGVRLPHARATDQSIWQSSRRSVRSSSWIPTLRLLPGILARRRDLGRAPLPEGRARAPPAAQVVHPSSGAPGGVADHGQPVWPHQRPGAGTPSAGARFCTMGHSSTSYRCA